MAGTLKQITGRARTFSIGFDQRGYDEMDYARIAARHFGTDHCEHYVTPAQLVSAVPQVASHYDQPFGNSSALPAFICARIAREHGVSKLLAGDGGDEFFGGNSRYAKQKVFELWWTLPSALRQALRPLIANEVTRRIPLVRKGASYVDQASVPMPSRLETYNLLQRFGAVNVLQRSVSRGRAAPQSLLRCSQGSTHCRTARVRRSHARLRLAVHTGGQRPAESYRRSATRRSRGRLSTAQRWTCGSCR